MKTLSWILIALFWAASAFAADEPDKQLFESKCSGCHTLEKSLNQTKDLAAWSRTIQRMVKYARGSISEQEGQTIAKYLASLGKTAESKTTAPATPAKKKETTAPVGNDEVFGFKKVRVDQFIDPSVCAGCHSEKFEQWNGSMHSKAFTDPLWRAATKYFVKDAVEPAEILEMKACVKCHTPLGFRALHINSPDDDYDQTESLPSQGIFCNWCHNISEVKHIGNAGYEVEPGFGEDDPSTMLGPLEDASSDYHPVQYSELHTQSKFCGLCHNVSHAGNDLPLELTYDEWKHSPYNTGDPATTVNCQDCHMRQKPGVPATGKTERPDHPGYAADNGPHREHVSTHYFVGANALVTGFTKSRIHAKMAVERLQNAADLEFIKSDVYQKEQHSQLKIKVINSGAGHYLPTGVTEIRQMWLNVEITDKNGKTILRSGQLDSEGKIDPFAVLYATILGNSEGEIEHNIAKADRILYDHRVPPKGWLIEKFGFQIPSDAVSPLTVKAVLKYRSASQAFVNKLLGDQASTVPVIDMVQAKTTLAF